jgi:uncharacterized protein
MRSLVPKLGLVIAVLVFVYVLLEFPPHVVERYDRLSKTSPTLGRVYLVGVLSVSGLTLAGGAYLFCRLAVNTVRQRAKKRRDQKSLGQMTVGEKEVVVTTTLSDIEVMIGSAKTDGDGSTDLREKARNIKESLNSGQLRIAAFGTISSGKSALLNTLAGEDVFASDVVGGTTVRCASVPLPSEDKVLLVDTPGLGEVQGIGHEQIAREQAMDADLIIFVLDNDMRSFEDAVLKVLTEAKKPLIVCFNKSDWYGPDNMSVLLSKTAQQVGRYGIPKEDVVAVRTKSASRTRVRVLEGGTEVEETVMLGADVDPLLERMKVTLKDRKHLHLNNLVDQVRRVLAETRERSRAQLDASAWEIVNRTTWQAATAAALSPLPILDLVIGMGFIGKMVKDLAELYQIQIDLESVRRLLGELGANSVSVVGANLATPTAGALAASWVKVVPGIGTLVGGALQGFMQALMVRWIGSTFIAYFRKEMKTDGGLADLARQKWLEVTGKPALTKLYQETLAHIGQPTQEVS